MLNKKGKAILFTFLILFFITAVNAESLDDNIYSDSVEIVNVESVDYVATIEEDAGPDNFSQLNKTINGKTTTSDSNNKEVELDKNYIYNSTTDGDFKNGINITKDMTINGKGHTIDGNHTARIFNVINCTLTIKNITLINGNATNGGAIYSENSNLTLINSTFINNTVRSNSYNGGAIYNKNSTLKVINSTFINNTVMATYTYGNGGAIYSTSNSNVTVVNSTFTNNRARQGGAIYVDTGVINISDSKFEDNNASNGGAVYINTGNITVINSIFENNNASYGGAIYITTANITLIKSNFNSNIAKTYYGGAIYMSAANATITDSNFNNNNANTGGAIYFYGYYYSRNGILNIDNSSFINNTAKYSGGAIYNANNITITNSYFANNVANITSGGAIYSYYKNMNLSNSKFENNKAGTNGGAIYIENNGYEKDYGIIVNNSTFDNNTAGKSGGAIYTRGAKITNSNFSNNNASEGGALFSVSDGTVVINNTKFTNNTASKYGGAIDVFSGSAIIDNSRFENNSAAVYGGAIYAASTVNVTDSIFRKNSANQGGAIYSSLNTNGIIANSTFDQNTATGKGGALYFDAISGIQIENSGMEIVNSEFTNNSANQGGAIYSYSILNITDSNFTQNTANADGGAIYSDKYLRSINSTFINNNAANGGALYVISNSEIVESSFNNNNATNGGAIYGINANILVDKSKFDENNATNGGAIYCTSTRSTATNLNVMNSEFDKNSGKLGDDIYTSYNTTVMNNTYTKDSYANIYANNTIINFSIITVLNNGTYYISSSDKFKVNATAFADGASVAGYDMIITDGKNRYNAAYVGYGVYEINENITADFTINHYSAIINGETEGNRYVVENGTVITNQIVIIVEDLTKYFGNDSKFVILLTDGEGNLLSNKTVNITINGVTYTRVTDSEGRILMGINLAPGVYDAEVSYGDITENATITILSTVEGKDLVKYYLNGTQYYAKFYNVDGTPLANTNVTFNINGVFYTRETDENGIAKLNINLNPGEYIITALNPASNQTYSNNVTVLTTIVGYDVVKYFKNGTQYYAIFTDLDGKPLAYSHVTFNIHGVFYTRTTDANGIAKLTINLNPGEYIITAINPVNNETYSNMITVLNVVESEDLEMTTNNRKQFTVTILGDHGAPLANAKVSFNIHGIFYHRTTDANGQVSLDINLIAGKYIITTYYNGYSVSNTINIK